MSETDDTDLLLLIPPDFFLVHSPELGFDSDCEIDNSLVKDSIVSDLITQVNDLESRICMIENLEKSATLCSTFNGDSYVNQSHNSLTESDILRFKENENLVFLENEFPKNSHFHQELPLNIEHNTYNLCYNPSLSLNDVLDRNEMQTVNNKSVGNNCIQNNEVNIDLENDSKHESKTDLLTEIDKFLGNRSNNTSVTKYFTDCTTHNEINLQNNTVNNFSSINDVLKPSTTVESAEKHSQSLALPEVHQLLKEMEDTQHEIVQKLTLRNPKYSQEASLQQSRSGTVQPSVPLGMDYLSSSYIKTMSNRQLENILDSQQSDNIGQNSVINHHTNKADAQLSYLLTSALTNKHEGGLKSDAEKQFTSPSRSIAEHRSLDVVKPDISKKKPTVTQSTNDNNSPTKNSTVRRFLNFEGKSLSPRISRSKTSLQFDPTIRGRFLSESQHNYDSSKEKLLKESFDRSNAGIRNGYSNDKPTSLSTQGATENKTMPNTIKTIDNKTSSYEIIQQKLSSNNLLSLSELWNNEPTFYSDDPNKLRQKLEEEKYRRQHCEQQIQALQLRVLEEREKLAVAIKVDQEKDKAILQITQSWKKLSDHWSELEEQRHSLAQQLEAEKESSRIKHDDLMKKVDKWEKEVSQALDLALGYKEKSESTQQQMNTLKSETDDKLDEAEGKINKLVEENEKITIENKTQLEQLHCLQDRIEEEEKLLTKLKIELEKSKKQVADYEAEVNVLREQKESLSIKLQDEKSRINILEKQKKELEVELSESVKREKAAQEGARLSNERIDVARTELRALYQGQLETVVKEKLQEFQGQLDAAEAALKDELYSKEKQWIEKSNHQYKVLQEKYSTEICQVEESYKAEIEKWKKKVIESEKLRSICENKLHEEKNRRAEIAHRLHSVMENQWREALNIISNPTQNMYEVLKDEKRERWPPNLENAERLKGGGDLKASRSNSGSSLLQCDDAPFCREGAVTSRKLQSSQDPQLKKYIEMLLERGSHQDPLQDSIDQTFSTDTSYMNSKWMMENERTSGEKMDRIHKPPWK